MVEGRGGVTDSLRDRVRWFTTHGYRLEVDNDEHGMYQLYATSLPRGTEYAQEHVSLPVGLGFLIDKITLGSPRTRADAVGLSD